MFIFELTILNLPQQFDRLNILKQVYMPRLITKLIVTGFTGFILSGCENPEILKISQNYPSTYSNLDKTTLQKLKSELVLTNPYLFQTVNDFGFIGASGNEIPSVPPTVSDLNRNEAQSVIRKFISDNATVLGIKNREEVSFERVDSFKIYDGSLKWMFQTGNQVYKGLQVYNSSIRFHIANGKITWCTGNWYPEIIIPEKFKINEKAVKSMLSGKVVGHYNIAGQLSTITISKLNLENAQFSKLIYPVETDEKIEIHVVWDVLVPDVFFRFFIDVMSGEILQEAPTIIS